MKRLTIRYSLVALGSSMLLLIRIKLVNIVSRGDRLKNLTGFFDKGFFFSPFSILLIHFFLTRTPINS